MPADRRGALRGEQKLEKTLLGEAQMRRMIRRMAGEIVERNGGAGHLMLVGIRTRGVPLAERIAAEIEKLEGSAVPIGVLDITLYRDDFSTIGPQPLVKETRLPGPIDNETLVLCDDVLFTGRTIRAALDALIDYGRPTAVQLAVLIDRGGRELPIQADFVGRKVSVESSKSVEVRFTPKDDLDTVMLTVLEAKDG
jgi:pyrimidine operon attenuation protein/uracil phosphoribosyltransferase